jgi:hypothetical protein
MAAKTTVEQIERVLAAHHHCEFVGRGRIQCICGKLVATTGDDGGKIAKNHNRHVARALKELFDKEEG